MIIIYRTGIVKKKILQEQEHTDCFVVLV